MKMTIFIEVETNMDDGRYHINKVQLHRWNQTNNEKFQTWIKIIIIHMVEFNSHGQFNIYPIDFIGWNMLSSTSSLFHPYDLLHFHG
jgi:hypothetical protein